MSTKIQIDTHEDNEVNYHQNSNVKKGDLGLGWIIAIFGVMSAIFIVVVVLIHNFWSSYTAVSNMAEVVTKVDNSLGDLTQGGSCTSFTMANFENLFGRNYSFNSTDSSLTLPKGDVTATLSCSSTPKASGSGPLRGELTFSGVSDRICSKFISNEVDIADAIQAQSDNSSSSVTVKFHDEVNPSGLATIGKTVCTDGSTSKIMVWLKGR